MAISASEFTKTSSSGSANGAGQDKWKKHIVAGSEFDPSNTKSPVPEDQVKGNTDGDNLLVDYNKSEVYHTEPLFIVGNKSLYGYENYKQYDQYSGHSLNNQPNFKIQDSTSTSNDPDKKDYYVVEENGKRLSSGKTYYLGYQTVMVPVKKES